MKRIFYLIAALVMLHSSAYAQKILFDNTKGETAGNADWVIDADQYNLGIGSSGPYIGGQNSNAQRIPTPAQSGINSSSLGTYWTGGISSWGVECVKTGYTVESLPWDIAITYGNTSNPQDLKNYDVYVVDEPNIPYTSIEKTAIINFVKNGGGLFMVSDHNVSDRNGDGWDSPRVWNDLFTNNGVQANPFGCKVDTNNFSGTFTVSNIAGDSLLNGPYGNVNQVRWSGGTSMTINTAVNPTIKAVAYDGVSRPIVAYGRYGKGKFVIMGDSSPTDDNTGDPGDQLYDGWIRDANGNHRKLIMNATIWLATNTKSNVAIETVDQVPNISIIPIPTTNELHIKSPSAIKIEITDLEGRILITDKINATEAKTLDISSFPKGLYLAHLQGDNFTTIKKIVKD